VLKKQTACGARKQKNEPSTTLGPELRPKCGAGEHKKLTPCSAKKKTTPCGAGG